MIRKGSNDSGMATFGLRYFAQLRSKYKGVFWRVEIWIVSLLTVSLHRIGALPPKKRMQMWHHTLEHAS